MTKRSDRMPSDAANPHDTVPATADGQGLRLLVLLRHGQAKSRSDDGDRGRELTKTGREQSAEMGEWLRRQGVRPDVVVVSPATRTRQTWDGLRAGGLSCEEVWSDGAIYEASPEDIVESIRAVPDDARTVLVIGHAPGIPGLAFTVEDHGEVPESTREVMASWPTASAAVIGHRGEWARFPSAETTLAAFHAPTRS